MTILTRDDCLKMDAVDPLKTYRDAFALPDGLIYLDGNSLGPQPKAAADLAADLVKRQWGQDLIKSWNTAGWFELPYKLGDKLGRLLGANPGEMIVTDSTGINIYKVLSLALGLNPDRKTILMENDNFPTDVYMAEGLLGQLGDEYDLKLVAGDDILDALTDDVAVVMVTEVNYKTGRLLDMKAIADKAHAVGALAAFDLCHSAGAVPVDLNAAGADLAVGCSYKYLNGGPGAPAFIFVAERHQNKAQQPLSGWWGHKAPFEFETRYRAGEGISQMASGTQPILSLAMVDCGLSLFLDVDMAQVRQKSVKLCDMFIELVESRCGAWGFELNTPRDAVKRGSQVSFNHSDGYAIVKALIAKDVIGDFRAPQNMRFGFAPLYVRYVDVWDAVDRLADIMESGEWQKEIYHARDAVT
ncbi:kynureninase [Kordiimonas sediminis]|uniref:Kynureninase n=1 Tax=Kordiimonas sediminis TaxID=1735581 RepID=A0A919E5S9_9PROT|nr:kynureninase [Kordiimonas sediminis]GHF16840.1 kynureninase [Kordiimonas sediminis]